MSSGSAPDPGAAPRPWSERWVDAVCLGFALPVDHSAPSDWAWILYLGICQIGLAYLFMTRSVRIVPALEASLLLLVEPVLNTLWAWLLHDEVPGAWARAGASLILLATLAHALRADTAGRPSETPIEAADPLESDR